MQKTGASSQLPTRDEGKPGKLLALIGQCMTGEEDNRETDGNAETGGWEFLICICEMGGKNLERRRHGTAVLQ